MTDKLTTGGLEFLNHFLKQFHIAGFARILQGHFDEGPALGVGGFRVPDPFGGYHYWAIFGHNLPGSQIHKRRRQPGQLSQNS